MADHSYEHDRSNWNVDVDDWITELSSDIQETGGNTGMEEMRKNVPSSSSNNLSQLSKVPVNLEGKKLYRDVSCKRICKELDTLVSLSFLFFSVQFFLLRISISDLLLEHGVSVSLSQTACVA
ncbi:unnamed protein product [Ilex paraguariensis]|uniref:Uncharacterized protein n=1 Tax=Ilex paraguariensis TaxID=185542 RepID=A0ABC8TGS5_9AQUA